jgi:hypothetical protein
LSVLHDYSPLLEQEVTRRDKFFLLRKGRAGVLIFRLFLK